MKTFHVTEAENLDAVLSGGLIPSIGERSKEIGETVPAVFLFHTETDLNDGLGNWLGEYFADTRLVVLEVDISGLVDHSTVGYEAVIHDVIQPDRIRFVRFE